MAESTEYLDFISHVQQEAAATLPEAELAARATLETLAERVSGGEATDIAEQLPSELSPWLDNPSKAERFDFVEFMRRVAERASVTLPVAEQYTRAVFRAISRTVSDDELHDLASELPRDLAALLDDRPAPRRAPTVGADRFVARVADRAHVDAERARRATSAALEALAERISGGEVDHLEERLPVELHQPLERGRAESHGAARRISLEEFVTGIAEREGVPPAEARRDTRAVFATLRESVGDDEFADIRAQLPDDYTELLARP
jgi:uncharacterized protein (DUF2267 family)